MLEDLEKLQVAYFRGKKKRREACKHRKVRQCVGFLGCVRLDSTRLDQIRLDQTRPDQIRSVRISRTS
jgi:hypothetical protein